MNGIGLVCLLLLVGLGVWAWRAWHNASIAIREMQEMFERSHAAEWHENREAS